MSDQGRRFSSEDDEAQYYLEILRDGTREQKIEARDRLSQLFEARGMLAEACELLEGNARTGLRDRTLFTRLASLYRRLGRDDDADAAMAEAASMLGTASRSPMPLQPNQLAPRSGQEHWGTAPNPFAQQTASGSPGYVPARPTKKRSTVKTMGLGCLGCAGLLVLMFIILAAIGSQSGATTSTTSAPATQKPAAVTQPQARAENPAQSAPAPTSKPVAKAEPKASGPARVGQRVESGGIALTVMGVQKASSLGQFLEAKPGRTYVIADVLIESVSRDNAPYNPFYFKIKDAEAREYTGTTFGAENSLKSGELPRGDKARGSIAFDVPADAIGLVISYQPIVIFGGYQTIRIQLD